MSICFRGDVGRHAEMSGQVARPFVHAPIALHEFANGSQRRKRIFDARPRFRGEAKRMTHVPLRIANDSNRPFGDDSMSFESGHEADTPKFSSA
jgi:hypothetical protein